MEDLKVKLIVQSKLTAICGLIATVVYLVIALWFSLAMLSELFNPSAMGILILFAPVAILLGVAGIFILISSIKLLRANRRADTADVAALLVLIPKNRKWAIVAIIVALLSFGIGIVGIPYIITSLMADSVAKNLAIAQLAQTVTPVAPANL